MRYFLAIGLYALAIICLSSPLFATLGFEYSALMALGLSLVAGFQAIHTPAERRSPGVLLGKSLALAALPLVLSVVSLVWLRNCAFWDGALFYLEVAVPTALLSAGFGYAAIEAFGKRRLATFVFLCFWFASFVLSLIPGYTNPQLFTYGWQYGFFPGFVWDEALELGRAYAFSRLEQALWLGLILSVVSRRFKWPSGKIVTGLLAIAIGTIYLLHDNLGISSTAHQIEETLDRSVSTSNHITLHFAKSSLDADEVAHLEEELRWYVYDIRSKFQLKDTARSVDVFIYPNSDALFQAIGTRAASIAKPWRGQVHITVGNLSSLKHELTHVLLAEIGVWPFYASYSTGLTEGAAMSVEPRYDGLYTLDEHAARILQMHFARGVSDVMAFTGFAANASQKSYVLAGSFSRYLLSQYGPLPFRRVYRSLSFEKEYGKPIDSLEAEWKRSLAVYMTPLGADDSARLRYYYDRSSIIYQPCVRRVGKLERKADEAFNAKEYETAVALYEQTRREGGGLGALIGESNALLHLDRTRQALLVLDTITSLDAVKQVPALLTRKGDLRAVLGDTDWEAPLARAESMHLSSGSFLSAWMHRALMQAGTQTIFRIYLDSVYHGAPRRSLVSLIDSMMDTPAPPLRAMLTLQYLKLRSVSRAEIDRQQVDALSLSMLAAPGLTHDDSLAFYEMGVDLEASGLTPITADVLCPAEFARARDELRREIDGEREFLIADRLRRGRESRQ